MRLPRCAVVGLLAFPVVATIALAQSNAERVANDAYTRSHDYDLLHQRIEVRNFNWDSTSFTGRVSTTLLALRPGLDSIILDAGRLLTIGRVMDQGAGATAARPLKFKTQGDSLIVYPAKPVGFRDTVRFTVEYRARVTNGSGLTFLLPEGRPHRPQQIWSQGEDMNNHFWFPTYDFPNDKMTWELEATVPVRYTVVSNGRRVSDKKNSDGTHTVLWRQDQPSATYLVSLIVAPLVHLADTWHDIPVEYYVYPEDSSAARRLFRVTPDMIDVYSRLTGLDYPWAKYAQTTVADFFGGMENVSATTLVDWLPDNRAYRDRPWYQWILIPHELAHQWFGDYVTTENWANMWLNEGFAEFLPGEYWRAKLGRHAEDDYFVDEYESFMRIDARRRTALAASGSNNIYPKGALVLRMLERLLGPERFWASMHTYLTRHAFGNATSDDLRQAVLEATGENLDWFWSQWVYQAGFPELAVTAAYDSAAKQVTLSVTQTQVDSAKPDSSGPKFTTPAVFRMPLTVRIGTARGDVVQSVTLAARQQTIEIPGVAAPPTMVVFDDGNAVLKTLNFEEPTTWLATQLARDPDLWNRLWVIRQLAARSADSLAASTLARAATSADYYLTRAQAAEALSLFNSTVALPPLERAAGDTSAAVRGSALEALGVVGGARAIALATAALHGDSSYEVRAAAVTALAHADPDHRRTVITEALGATSYQNVIRSAALRAIVQLDDTSFLGTVETLLGEYRNPAHALGQLANHGSPRALDALSRHLDDERPYVRRWVLEAFRYTLNPDLGLPRLRAALAGGALRYPDTRTEASALVERLEQHKPGM